MVTVKTPPVEGIRATSPRSVLKVERSSWANFALSAYVLYCIFEVFRDAYVGRSQHPFTLGAVFDGYSGQIDAFGSDVVAAEFLVLFCGRALLDRGHWHCHFVYTVSFVDTELNSARNYLR